MENRKQSGTETGGILTRLFRLTADPARRDEFLSVGEYNLTTSLRQEPGTLAMYATHLPEDVSVNYIFEVYRDQAAYAIHAASEQFRAYGAMAKEVLTDRAVYSLRPELLLEKPGSLMVTGENRTAPRLAEIVTAEGAEARFRDAVSANMKASVEQEPGVLAMYAATAAEDSSRWYFWEVYASPEDYARHRETPHFLAYLAATADCVAEKRLIPLAADTMVSHGGLACEREA